MPREIRVQPNIVDELLRHARREPQVECCGLLGGRDGVICSMYPATNALASATAYEIAPRELFSIFKKMRGEEQQHLGLYHSHPAGENIPSPIDIEQANYPEQAYFILSPRENAVKPVRAFLIREGKAEEIEVVAVFG